MGNNRALSAGNWIFICVLVLSAMATSASFELNEVMPRLTGEHVFADFNSLKSSMSLQPFSYYSLPYCKPPEGISKRSFENFGELIRGEEIANSPYQFRVNINESVYLCSTEPLSQKDVNLFKRRIRESYRVEMMLENLPATWFAGRSSRGIPWIGFPVGYRPYGGNDYYIINHLKVQVFGYVYRFEADGNKSQFWILGFDVLPCSVKYDPNRISENQVIYDNVDPASCTFDLNKLQIIREGERVAFTYEVEFVETQFVWPGRSNSRESGRDRVHWFSIIISQIAILFLTGIMVRIILKHKREENIVYEASDQEAQAKMNLLVKNSLTEPEYEKLLCAMVGAGVQLMGTAFVAATLYAIGFMAPPSQGSLLFGITNFNLFLGGFVGAYLRRTMRRTSEGWKSVSWSISCFLPGTVFVIHSPINLILWQNRSTSAVPLPMYLQMFCLWFFISVPVIFLGGFAATQAGSPIFYPHIINRISKEVGTHKIPLWFVVLGMGTLPFGTIFTELFYISHSIWFGSRFYCDLQLLQIVLLLLVIVCAEVSVIVTHVSFRREDYKWWWKAFFASGSTGLYVFVYGIKFLVFDLQGLSGFASIIIYLGYLLIISTGIMLSAGSIGFLASFYFVRKFSSSSKLISSG